MTKDREAVFVTRVRKTGNCWFWTAGCNSQGYGQFSIDGQNRCAHVLAYALWVGPVPEGFDVDHRCHNRSRLCKGGPRCRHRRCVRPSHLALATRRQNTLAGKGSAAERARQTHCIHGHEFTPENTKIRHDGHGRRACRRCGQFTDRLYSQRRKHEGA